MPAPPKLFLGDQRFKKYKGGLCFLKSLVSPPPQVLEGGFIHWTKLNIYIQMFLLWLRRWNNTTFLVYYTVPLFSNKVCPISLYQFIFPFYAHNRKGYFHFSNFRFYRFRILKNIFRKTSCVVHHIRGKTKIKMISKCTFWKVRFS